MSCVERMPAVFTTNHRYKIEGLTILFIYNLRLPKSRGDTEADREG